MCPVVCDQGKAAELERELARAKLVTESYKGILLVNGGALVAVLALLKDSSPTVVRSC
jgi:hypothetical protein